MSLHGQSALHRRLLGATVVSVVMLTFILVMGQFSQLSSVLGHIQWLTWMTFLPLTACVLQEAVLPIGALFACALTFNAWRQQGVMTVYQSSGRHPIGILLPAVTLGLCLSVVVAGCAHFWGPQHLRTLKGEVQTAWASELKTGGVDIDSGDIISFVEPDEAGGAVWFLLPAREASPPTLGRAQSVHVHWSDRGPEAELVDVEIWAADTRVSAQHLTVKLDSSAVNERLKMLGPPNALASSALDQTQIHHRFVYQRRSSMSAIVCLWTVFGALIGLSFGAVYAVLAPSALVATNYWMLRAGELAARHGDYPVWLAAWGPVLLSLSAVLIMGYVWRQRLILQAGGRS